MKITTAAWVLLLSSPAALGCGTEPSTTPPWDEPLDIAASFAFGPLPEGRSRSYPRWGGKPDQPPKFLRSRLFLEPGWKVFVGSSD
ncbi:hypothetical protein [Sorangium sp. So ce362]|uniref:hypothetical protein n=1 Tax=Sorangium sp. So ce362 TaxID=3133303 RepID=UPI003F5F061E